MIARVAAPALWALAALAVYAFVQSPSPLGSFALFCAPASALALSLLAALAFLSPAAGGPDPRRADRLVVKFAAVSLAVVLALVALVAVLSRVLLLFPDPASVPASCGLCVAASVAVACAVAALAAPRGRREALPARPAAGTV